MNPGMLGAMLGSISVFVSFIVAALVLYSNNFIIRRRKRELGTYLLLGMNQHTVARMLFVETLAVGAAASALGMAAGVVFSGIFSLIFTLAENTPIHGSFFAFSPTSALLTVILYALIFLGVGILSSIQVSRFTLVSLLNADRKNEVFRARNPWVTGILGGLSLLVLAAAYLLAVRSIVSPDFNPLDPVYFLIALLVTVGSLGFFYAGVGFVFGLLRRVDTIHWKGLNAFTMQQIMKKINSNTLVLTAINLLLAIILTSIGMLIMIKTVFDEMEAQTAPTPYVINYLSPADPVDGFDQAANSSPKNPLLQKIALTVYPSGIATTQLLLPEDQAQNEKEVFKANGECNVMAVTPYNQLRQVKGLPPVALAGDEIAVNVGPFATGYTHQVQRAIQQGLKLAWQGKEYAVRQVVTESLGQNVTSLICNLVAPDAALAGLPPDDAQKMLFYNYAQEADPQVYDSLLQEIHREDRGGIVSRKEDLSQLRLIRLLILFAGLYLEMILLMACATVLGLQQLIDAVESAAHYRTLRNLGTDESEVRRSITRQVTFFFFAPVGLAALHSLFALGAFLKLFGYFIGGSLLGTLGVFGLLAAVYGGYFWITRQSCIRLAQQAEQPAAA
jgi:putative ABC transport system permease protein